MSKDKRTKAIARITLDAVLSLYNHMMEQAKGEIQKSMDKDLCLLLERVDNLPSIDDGEWTDEQRLEHGARVRASKPQPAGLWFYEYSDREPTYISYEQAAEMRNVAPHTMRVMISKSPVKAITIWRNRRHHVLSKTKDEAVVKRALRLRYEESQDEDDIFQLSSAPIAPKIFAPEHPPETNPTAPKPKTSKTKTKSTTL